MRKDWAPLSQRGGHGAILPLPLLSMGVVEAAAGLELTLPWLLLLLLKLQVLQMLLVRCSTIERRRVNSKL